MGNILEAPVSNNYTYEQRPK